MASCATLCYTEIGRIRNKIAFEQAEMEIQKMKLAALSHFWEWVKDIGGEKTNTIVKFICWLEE